MAAAATAVAQKPDDSVLQEKLQRIEEACAVLKERPTSPVSLEVETFARGVGRVSVPAVSAAALVDGLKRAACIINGGAPGKGEFDNPPRQEDGWDPSTIVAGLNGLRVAAEAMKTMDEHAPLCMAVVDGDSPPAIAMLDAREAKDVIIRAGKDLVRRWRILYPKGANQAFA